MQRLIDLTGRMWKRYLTSPSRGPFPNPHTSARTIHPFDVFDSVPPPSTRSVSGRQPLPHPPHATKPETLTMFTRR